MAEGFDREFDQHLGKLLDEIAQDALAKEAKGYRVFVASDGQVALLTIRGRVLFTDPEAMLHEFREADAAIPGHVELVAVDLHDCEYLSSAAIQSLVTYFADRLDNGRQIVLLHPVEKIRRTLEVMQMQDRFRVVDDIADIRRLFGRD